MPLPQAIRRRQARYSLSPHGQLLSLRHWLPLMFGCSRLDRWRFTITLSRGRRLELILSATLSADTSVETRLACHALSCYIRCH